MSQLAPLLWPASRFGEAVEVVAGRAGLSSSRTAATPPSSKAAAELREWAETTCERLGIDAVPVEISYGDLELFLSSSAPSILCVSESAGSGDSGFLILVHHRARFVVALGPDLEEHRVERAQLTDELSQRSSSPGGDMEDLLRRTGVSGKRLAKARRQLGRDRGRAAKIADGFVLRLAPGAPERALFREEGLARWLWAFAAAYTADHVLFVASWWILGRAALGGFLEWSWLLAWGLVLFTMLPFRLGASWFEGRFAVAAGGLLKRRLLRGALELRPDEVRHLGSGHHLGRVIESEAVESLALGGGFLSLAAIIELSLAVVILALGAGGWAHAALLLAFCGLMAWIVRRYLRRREHWTRERLEMSRELVEKMVGHRTRLAQEDPRHWYDEEDALLARYFSSSRTMDDVHSWIALLPRVWLVLGLLGLAPAFVAGTAPVEALAIGLGGLLLSYRALTKLVVGLAFLADAWISWSEVKELMAASRRHEPAGDASLVLAASDGETGAGLVDVTDVSFRYEGRSSPSLNGVSLTIRAGERLLLLGPSGGGKSTLISLLAGQRRPDAGLVLLHGLDRASLGGHGWMRRITSAPQFHENWILTETFAFNLLMGRRWPPTPEDLTEAEAVCRELGLGPLLERMPAGMLQMVGETGWQLSHGEKSRVFAARALLQGAELTILDESFGALDPESLIQAIACARDRARTLLLVAHP